MLRNVLQEHRDVAIVFSVAVLAYVLLFVGAWYLAAQHATPLEVLVAATGDSREYVDLAEGILTDGTYALHGVPEFFRAPGYPAFLALLLTVSGGSLLIIPLMQILLTAFSAACIYLLGKHFFEKWVGVCAATLFVLDPTTLIHTITSYTEPLFVAVLLLCTTVLLIMRQRRWTLFLVGLLFGYLILIRPLALFLLPLFVLYLAWKVWRSHGTRPIGIQFVVLFLLGALLLPVGWAYRNYELLDHFSISSLGTYNALFYNAVEFTVAREGTTREEVKEELFTRIGSDDLSELRSFAYTEEKRTLLKEYIGDHILSYGIFHTLKTVPYFVGSSIDATHALLYHHEILQGAQQDDINISALLLSGSYKEAIVAAISDLPSLIERIFWALMLLSAALYTVVVVWTRKPHMATAVFFLLLIGAFAMLTGPVSFPRYRLPAEPFLFLLGAAGFGMLGKWMGQYILRIWPKRQGHTQK